MNETELNWRWYFVTGYYCMYWFQGHLRSVGAKMYKNDSDNQAGALFVCEISDLLQHWAAALLRSRLNYHINCLYDICLYDVQTDIYETSAQLLAIG